MAPLIHELSADRDFISVVAVTGQHRQMLDQVLHLFEIKPQHDLGLMEEKQTLEGLTARALAAVTALIGDVQPDAVVVQGDTTTTFATALAAYYRAVPVIHLEAGLRTGDLRAPFPEEANRRFTSVLAALHLTPTADSQRNLLAENIPADRIVVTGNTVIDSLFWVLSRKSPILDPTLGRALEGDARIVLVTAHRRESWGEPMRMMAAGLRELVDERPDIRLVFPVHLNPTVREAVEPSLIDHERVHLLEPLLYSDFCHLMNASDLILTDSGGIQEEAPSLGKPVLVLRIKTERPEAVEAGTVRLVGMDPLRVLTETRRLLDDAASYEGMARAINPYGDGAAAGRCAQAIRHMFSLGPRPAEFSPESGKPSEVL